MSINTSNAPKELECPNCSSYITKREKTGLSREQLEEYIKKIECQVEAYEVANKNAFDYLSKTVKQLEEMQAENKDLKNKVQYWKNAYETCHENFLECEKDRCTLATLREKELDDLTDNELVDILTKRGYVGTLSISYTAVKNITVGYPKK